MLCGGSPPLPGVLGRLTPASSSQVTTFRLSEREYCLAAQAAVFFQGRSASRCSYTFAPSVAKFLGTASAALTLNRRDFKRPPALRQKQMAHAEDAQSASNGVRDAAAFVFPGAWVGGVALVAAPLLLVVGALLRLPFHFFYPQQLAAFEAHPVRMTIAYNIYALGWVVMLFAILALVQRIGKWSPVWAAWGGCLAILGLFTRTWFAGIDHSAFQLVLVQGLEPAVQAVGDSYRAWAIFRSFNGYIIAGWIVLAIGAYRSGTMGMLRSVALALAWIVPFGALKGTEIRALGLLGLCIALIPLGVAILRDAPPLSRRARFWVAAFVVGWVAFFILARIFPFLTN